ncbi:hypothetical protein ACFW2X_34320 [Streptomyces antibioticus]|uniref:hypothetical protein n=1 Tax=Streptomyces antibioticus TaxID=1890 RepID=UPI00368BEED1
MSQVLYSERSWNPLARTVELTEAGLRRGGRTTALGELNLAAMAEAFLRGRWLGGGGAERPRERLANGPGVVPVTRVTGTAAPLRVRHAAEFADRLGELAVRHRTPIRGGVGDVRSAVGRGGGSGGFRAAGGGAVRVRGRRPGRGRGPGQGSLGRDTEGREFAA